MHNVSANSGEANTRLLNCRVLSGLTEKLTLEAGLCPHTLPYRSMYVCDREGREQQTPQEEKKYHLLENSQRSQSNSVAVTQYRVT